MFSIVIPLYNKEDTIIRALDSIKKQTYQEYEVIIINDGSNDDSEQVVIEWLKQQGYFSEKIKIISQENSGVSVARNNGVNVARNNYIVFLDADDYWDIIHLENMKNLIDKYNKNVDIFSCAIKQIENGKFIYPKLGDYENFLGVVDFFSVTLISSGFINSSSVCVKKDSFFSYTFPEKMKNHEDIVTWARLANKKGFAFCSERSATQVLDTTEASCSVDFSCYIKLTNYLINIDYNKKKLICYINRYILLNLFFVRIESSNCEFIKKGFAFMQQILKCQNKFFVSNLFFNIFFVFLIPKKILCLFRNYRKNT